MKNNILVEITLVISFIILTIMIAFMISGIISIVNAIRYRIKQRKIEKMIHNDENMLRAFSEAIGGVNNESKLREYGVIEYFEE